MLRQAQHDNCGKAGMFRCAQHENQKNTLPRREGMKEAGYLYQRELYGNRESFRLSLFEAPLLFSLRMFPMSTSCGR